MSGSAKRIIVPFSESDLKLIEDFRHANSISTRAGAIRRLIRDGSKGESGLAGAIRVLRDHRGELSSLGVRHAAVFGSVARGEGGAGSDIDILIEFDKRRVPDLFGYAGICRRLGELIAGADVVEKDSLDKRMAERILQEAVHAF